MKFRIILFFACVLALASCDNELDINAPWRETPVVYAVIDLGQDSQIFRIQKTFQNGEGQTTTDISQIADSLTFKNITVTLVNNNTGNTIQMKRLAPRKEAGFFNNQDSSFWGESLPGFFNPGNTYKLLIKSFNTGNTYEGVTNVVQPFVINPISGSGIDLVNKTTPSFSYRLNGGGINSATYDLTVRLNYYEAPASNPSDTSNLKSLDYIFVLGKMNFSPSQAVTLSTAVVKDNFIAYIRGAVKPNDNVVRTFKSLEYVASGSNRTYNDMIDVNKPSTTIVGKSGDYSNISNGIGVFASRTSTKLRQPITPASVILINDSLLNP